MIRSKPWSLHRIAGAGCAAGLAALLLWPVYYTWPEIALLPFMLALAAAGLCGTAILWLTMIDLARRPGRGSRLRPIRTFDIVIGLMLAVPSLLELRAIGPDGLVQLSLL